MSIKHQNSYKHLLNFVGSNSRPILTNFHFKDGDVFATNSHILLKLINKASEDLREFNFNPKTLKINYSEYPDINRLIPTKFNSEWLINAKDITVVVNFLKGFAKNEAVKVKLGVDGLSISNDSISSVFAITNVTGDTSSEFTCNATYLKHILSFIGDYTDELVTIGFTSEFRPVVFKHSGLFEALLTPIRTMKGRAYE